MRTSTILISGVTIIGTSSPSSRVSYSLMVSFLPVLGCEGNLSCASIMVTKHENNKRRPINFKKKRNTKIMQFSLVFYNNRLFDVLLPCNDIYTEGRI